MRRRTSIFFVLILLLTLFCVCVNLSQPYDVSIGSIHKKFEGISLNIGPLRFKPSFPFRMGLDLEGGTSITLKADMKDVAEVDREKALDSAKAVIERRINPKGTLEPLVQTSKTNKDYRIIVEIPGITDVNQAVQLVGRTAKLTFWEQNPDVLKLATGSAMLATSSGVPLGVEQLLGPSPVRSNLTGSDLKQASVTFNSNSGKPEVQLLFTSDGSKKFGDITKRNVGKIVAIALDQQLIEAPRVNQPIYGGSAVITGEFTTEQAKVLQNLLNGGALPVPLSVLEQRAVGATLGQVSLEKSLIAGIVGFFVIVLFMIFLYGRLGIIASLAFILYTLIVLTLFRLIPVTLTLSGIAGFILSIGIAVDANILIFERMKEELRRGRSHESAVELGFSRAWLAIRDSNVASLITSAVLLYFGTGIVKGFAFTLALGILSSMFSAIFVTRTLLQVFYKKT